MSTINELKKRHALRLRELKEKFNTSLYNLTALIDEMRDELDDDSDKPDYMKNQCSFCFEQITPEDAYSMARNGEPHCHVQVMSSEDRAIWTAHQQEEYNKAVYESEHDL